MNKFSRRRVWGTFIDAMRGIGHALRGGRNFRMQSTAALATVILGFVLGISPEDWLFVLLAIGLVLGLDLMNHAVERLTDRISPEFDPAIGTVKDIAAGAVLLAAIFALVIGIIIFGPKILLLIRPS